MSGIIEILGKRGALSPQIQELCKEFLGREISTVELRLMPYIDYVMKNNQRIDPSKINQEEREVLSTLRKEGYIEGGASGLSITKEYYDFIQQILWLGYVCIIHEEEF
jgi:hypothetical protein